MAEQGDLHYENLKGSGMGWTGPPRNEAKSRLQTGRYIESFKKG